MELTSAKITYQVSGGLPKVFDWTGSLGFLEQEEVTLPFQDGAFYLGDGSNIFTATISEPNGSSDEYSDNDALKSKFILPPIAEGSIILNLTTNNYANENELRLYDASDNVIFSRTGGELQPNTIYRDTLSLDTGCYRVEITDQSNDGLSYWANSAQGSGSFRLWTITNGTLGLLKNFESEFGHKIDFAFAVDAMTIDTIEMEINGVPVVIIGGDTFEVNGDDLYPLSVEKLDGFDLGIYPNPNNGSFNVELLGYTGVIEMQLYDLSGKIVHQDKLISMGGTMRSFQLDLKPGMYLARFNGELVNETRRIIIE